MKKSNFFLTKKKQQKKLGNELQYQQQKQKDTFF